MASFGPTATSAPAGAIILRPGDDISALVYAAPTGATFYFEPGVYRGVSLWPKDGQTFIGAEGAILNGSAVLTDWTQSGNLWVIGGQTQRGPVFTGAEFMPDTQRPGYPETVFLDNTPLKPVDDLSKVVPGTFYFDYGASKIYIADNPAGHTVEASKQINAFHGTSTNVTVQNLVIEKYGNQIQDGAIQGDQSWIIRDNEVRLNYSVGITAHDGSQIIGNYVHDNGQMGLGGHGDNILVQGNELATNGFWSGISPYWEAGGFKFAETDNLVVRGNYSHDNYGSGMWTDINNIHTLYEDNVVVHNTINGIQHELSYDAIIRNNTLVGNGYGDARGWGWGAEIDIQNSQNVQVYGNRVDMTGGGNGIVMIQQNRGAGTYGTWTTTGNQIHDNIIVDHDGHGTIGGFADYNQSGMLDGANSWSNNQYFMSDGPDRFQWVWDLTFAQFKAAAHETGSLSQSYPDTGGWLAPAADRPTSPVVIETWGSTSLVQVDNNYFVDAVGASSGPQLMSGGTPILAGQFGGWTPIGAEAVEGGYAVAWKNGASDEYTVWNTDTEGNYLRHAIGAVAGSDSGLEALETVFQQDLNSDGQISGPTTTTIEAFGLTRLDESAGQFFLQDSAGDGPSLKFEGVAVVSGRFGGWMPIGAEAVEGGYAVAWKNGASDEYTVWNTDSEGNYLRPAIGAVSGSDSGLEALETVFQQDLNSDGQISGPTTTTIEAFGSTRLDESASRFFMQDSAGDGPSLKFEGVAVVSGRFGGWMPIGAEAAEGGYAVAWKNGASDEYTVWNTDSEGNYLRHAIGAVSGSDSGLESLETVFQQDLNSDGQISGPTTTTIEAFGSTRLDESAGQFFLQDSAGDGPSLKFEGVAVVSGRFGGWMPIGAEAVEGGYAVAWKNGALDEYTVWNTDSEGNYLRHAIGAVSGRSSDLEVLEPNFQQDLNGDGTVGAANMVSTVNAVDGGRSGSADLALLALANDGNAAEIVAPTDTHADDMGITLLGINLGPTDSDYYQM